MRIRIPGAGLPLIGLFLLCSACGPAGELHRETDSVERDGAESVLAEVRITTGFLQVAGGADKLMSGEFAYQAAALKPEIRYRTIDQRGSLVVKQAAVRGWKPGSGGRNDWDLRFNGKTPLDLRFVLQGGAEGRFDLQGLQLTKLSFDIMKGGIVADASGGQPLLTRLDIQTKSGDADVKMTGDYASLSMIKTISDSGDLVLDLSGTWHADLKGILRSNTGGIRLYLPVEAGVLAKVQSRSGGVRAEGLRLEQGAYVNRAYGVSNVTLDLEIYTGAGRVALISADQAR
jgi:hypothetical protein